MKRTLQTLRMTLMAAATGGALLAGSCAVDGFSVYVNDPGYSCCGGYYDVGGWYDEPPVYDEYYVYDDPWYFP